MVNGVFWWLIYYKLRELLKMAIEIVDLPSYKMVTFNSYGTVYQRVSWLLFVSQRAEIYTWSVPKSVYPQSNWWAVWTIPSWFFFTVPNISRPPSVAHPQSCWWNPQTLDAEKLKKLSTYTRILDILEAMLLCFFFENSVPQWMRHGFFRRLRPFRMRPHMDEPWLVLAP